MKSRDKAHREPLNGYTAVPLTDLVAVFERAASHWKLQEGLDALRELLRDESDRELLVPDGLLGKAIETFALLGTCKGTTGTWTPTLSNVIVNSSRSGMSGVTIVAFDYLTASSDPPCAISVSSVVVTVGATTAIVAGTDSPAAGGGSGSYDGIISGTGPAGLPATVTVVFSATCTGWCNSCTPASAAAAATVTTI